MAMNSTSAILRPVSHLAAWGLLAAFATGCSAADSGPVNDEPAPALRQQVVGEFILHAQPSKRKATFHEITPKLRDAMAKYGPGLQPQALTDITIEADGTPGSGTAGTVELVTTAVYDTFGGGALSASCDAADLFCADVTLNSFHPKTLNLAYVQVTAITDATGLPTTTHSGTNSDFPVTTGLDNSLGLWAQHSTNGGQGVRETAAGFSYGSSTSVLSYTTYGSAASSATTWKFANPDDADTYIRFRVMAAVPGSNSSYSGHQITSAVTFRASTYVDACTTTSGTNLTIQLASDGSNLPLQTNSAQAVFVPMPFSFTFYGTTYAAGTKLNFSKFGNLGFAPATTKLTNNPATPTSTTAPAPGFWPWWDSTAWGTPGGMCARVIGSAPTRSLLIGWKKLASSGNGSSGPFVNYSVELHETTDEILFNYDGNAGAGTWSAAIGGINSTGGAMTGSNNSVTSWPATTAGVQKRYVLQPIP
jgi:hypothetical protein